DSIEANHPPMNPLHHCLDEGVTRLTVVQVHPDAASMEFHLEVNAKHCATVFDYLDAQLTEQYYGPMSEKLAADLAKWEDSSVEVTRMPVYEGGFTRTTVR